MRRPGTLSAVAAQTGYRHKGFFCAAHLAVLVGSLALVALVPAALAQTPDRTSGKRAQTAQTGSQSRAEQPTRARRTDAEAKRKSANRVARNTARQETQRPSARSGGASSKPERTGSAKAQRIDQAEVRLLEVYRLIGAGQARVALNKAEHLVRDFPNFQLAHLAMGDLLAAQARTLAQFGDAPTVEADSTLSDLRRESALRVAASQFKPSEGAVPTAFVEISQSAKHAIAVDASRSRLYLFENTSKGLRLVADYYASVGKLGTEKEVEGDQRTPLGVYYITSRLDDKQLADLYGSGALPLNYPNALDLRRGKTGSGIWLHGTPRAQFSRAPEATDGCVAIANPDLERILSTVEPRTTPVVIARQLQWVAPQGVLVDRESFTQVLDSWRSAKTSGDLRQLLGFYAYDFQGLRDQSTAQWEASLQADIRDLRGREIQLKDLSLLHWQDSSETMVVTFAEIPVGARTGAVKRQYWRKQGQQWQIFFEGVIG